MAMPEIGRRGQLKLKQSRVLIVGVGGLGSPIAMYLARAGVGTIGIMDGDHVNISNLGRQVLYDEEHVGQLKAICAQQRLQAMNSETQVVVYPRRLTNRNARKIIADYDVVVDGTDNHSVRYLISDVCCELHKPYVYGAICGLEGQVAVLCKGQASYRTLFPDEEAMLAKAAAADKRVVGVTPGVVGCVEASQVLQLICGYGEPLIDRLWTIDLRDLQTCVVHL